MLFENIIDLFTQNSFFDIIHPVVIVLQNF